MGTIELLIGGLYSCRGGQKVQSSQPLNINTLANTTDKARTLFDR